MTKRYCSLLRSVRGAISPPAGVDRGQSAVMVVRFSLYVVLGNSDDGFEAGDGVQPSLVSGWPQSSDSVRVNGP